MTMARANLAGTIEYAPEKRFTPTNVAVTVFTVRVPSPPRMAKNPQSAGAPQEDMMVRVNCWRNLADQVATLQKGQVVLLEGRLIINSFTTQDGQPRKQFELEANQVMLLPGLPQPLEVGAMASAPAPMPQSPQQAPLPGGGGGGGGGYGGSSAPSAAAPQTGGPQTYSVGLSDLSAEEFMTEDDIPF